MKKTKCEKCGGEYANKAGNYKRHNAVCDGTDRSLPTIDRGKCKHCNQRFDLSDRPMGWMANHSRWCIKNSLYKTYREGATRYWIRSMTSEKALKKKSDSIKLAHARGCYSHINRKDFGKPHTEKSKKLIQEKALASAHRRLVRSIRDYTKKDGTVVKLDSSWEEILAKRLDDLDISWIRPESTQWIDKNGVKHNYFPDFYLTEYNLYLDPKNKIAYNTQIEKIECLKVQMPNLIFLTTKEECSNFCL